MDTFIEKHFGKNNTARISVKASQAKGVERLGFRCSGGGSGGGGSGEGAGGPGRGCSSPREEGGSKGGSVPGEEAFQGEEEGFQEKEGSRGRRVPGEEGFQGKKGFQGRGGGSRGGKFHQGVQRFFFLEVVFMDVLVFFCFFSLVFFIGVFSMVFFNWFFHWFFLRCFIGFLLVFQLLCGVYGCSGCVLGVFWGCSCGVLGRGGEGGDGEEVFWRCYSWEVFRGVFFGVLWFFC